MLCLRAIHLESPSFCLRGNVASRRIWKTKHTQFNIKILLHQIFHLNSFHSTQLLQSVVSAGSACVCVLFQLRTDVHLLDLCHFWVVFPALPSESESGLVVSHSLWPHGLYSPWNSPGQNAGVGSLSLLQGTFSTQGLNPGLLHCRQNLYQLNQQGSLSMARLNSGPCCTLSWGSLLLTEVVTICKDKSSRVTPTH